MDLKPGETLFVTEPASSPSSDQTTQDPQWTVVAHLLRPQGRKGEILADLLTDFPERFSSTPRVFLAPEGFAGSESGARIAEIVEFWLPMGRNQGRIVFQFAEIESITQAEQLAGLDVIVRASERVELDDDTNYVSDLIGCTLYDHANPAAIIPLGDVTDVQFTTTPDGTRRLEEAAPLLAVKTSKGDEILVPFVKAFLMSVDTAARRIDMTLPEGLVDVNRP